MPLIWAVCRRDLLAAFTTPLAWLVLAAWSLLVNLIFFLSLNAVHGTPGAGTPLYVSGLTLGVFFLTLLAPALTMTSFSGERAQGTMQLLMTVPVREHHLILGKFLAVFATLAALIAATLVHPLILSFVSDFRWPQLLAGYAGLLLTCALFAALGVWISLLVDSPVAAYVITFAAIAVLLMVGVLPADSWAGPVGQALGVGVRANAFIRGEVALGNVAYFLAGTAAFLLLAHSALLAKRIHG